MTTKRDSRLYRRGSSQQQRIHRLLTHRLDNKQYLKILDVLEILDKAPVDAEHPYKIIGAYIERLGLEYVRLLALANNYYNRNTILQLAHVAGGR